MEFKQLKDPSLVILFAYSPVGFGHLRVTDALFHGLPEGMSPLLLGSQDTSISVWYRFVTIHPLTRHIMEFIQSGWGEDIFLFFYRWLVESHKALLYRQLTTILDEQIEQPKTLLMVATHFGLAHQIAPVKERIERERNIKMYLVVQITDDSPQHVWYVPHADLIFAPSQHTKKELLAYAQSRHLPLVNIVVNPYPVSPTLLASLSARQITKRNAQYNPHLTEKIHVMVPVSGAAVGMQWLTLCMKGLARHSDRYMFHIAAKQAKYTRNFLETFSMGANAELHTSGRDREVVDLYEDAYKKEVIGLELTKPSEQSFKALLTPKQRGGVILLFNEYVGKQEQDNISFLMREELIPSLAHHRQLWDAAQKHLPCPTHLFEQAHTWRGLVMPRNPSQASDFIHWAMHEGIFQKMSRYTNPRPTSHIVQPDGVAKFWQIVENFLLEKAAT